MEQARALRELEELQRALEAREAQMEAIQSSSSVLALKKSYDRMVADLAVERDELQKERTQLLQVALHPPPPHKPTYGPQLHSCPHPRLPACAGCLAPPLSHACLV